MPAVLAEAVVEVVPVVTLLLTAPTLPTTGRVTVATEFVRVWPVAEVHEIAD
ncbi:hypothetical protein N803_03545 [Knoellia subterranea KCTC 19937]|uniref:Uncharacterized protein n=1 Tax=Knoellia subterranea KCTC 19937 TaxID=1385521 RepID=A0A0A0JSF8_9MICO|nr:hypothetical protein N803_03545 [Knoellia subterranea KCTC 19937]